MKKITVIRQAAILMAKGIAGITIVDLVLSIIAACCLLCLPLLIYRYCKQPRTN